MMAGMRNWLHGGELDGRGKAGSLSKESNRDPKRVVVVHCKAGKGRSGTVTCSYLISEEGWKAEDALSRFTERRMRPKFGAGVSIPSQLRWVSYVDRWTRYGKKYVDRPIEIVEIHAWGLRNGVKVDVAGFIDDGKKIKVLHTFSKKERVIVEAGAPATGGVGEMLWDLAGYTAQGGSTKAPEEAELADGANVNDERPDRPDGMAAHEKRRHAIIRKGTGLVQKVTSNLPQSVEIKSAGTGSSSSSSGSNAKETPEPGGRSVILRPTEPIRVPNSDINVSVELRNKTHKSLNLTMVSAVAHVWFNAFFDGQGPEKDGKPDASGVFSIDWEALDGIKGSSRKGSRALDRLSVVWRVADSPTDGEVINEPAEGEPIPQVEPADWKGRSAEHGKEEKDIGLRTQTDTSADISRASSIKSTEGKGGANSDQDDTKALEGVRAVGPSGQDLTEEDR